MTSLYSYSIDLTTLRWPWLLCNAPVPLSRIYSRTSTNEPFELVRGVHSWSFQSIPIHSSNVLLMRIWSAGEYESFEHVQKLCVASTNEFHFCLCVLRTCSYRVCLTAYVLYSSNSHCIRTIFWLFLLYTRSFVHVGGTGADTNGDGMCQRLLQVPIRVHIRVNLPLSYTWCVDSYIFVLFSYSILFILVRSCEILGRTE